MAVPRTIKLRGSSPDLTPNLKHLSLANSPPHCVSAQSWAQGAMLLLRGQKAIIAKDIC